MQERHAAPHSARVVLVMLAHDACVPCYVPARRVTGASHLSSATLARILEWAAAAEFTPDLYFAAGSGQPLPAAVASALLDMGDRVVTPLLTPDRHAELGVPFSAAQTVVVDGLESLRARAELVAERQAIVRIAREEIGLLHSVLCTAGDSTGDVTLRMEAPARLAPADLALYEQQLVLLGRHYLRQFAAGSRRALRVTNVFPHADPAPCAAGSGHFTIAPDGQLHACPAFFLAGHAPAGSISGPPPGGAAPPETCACCHQRWCTGCPFLQAHAPSEAARACEVHRTERRARSRILRSAALSNHLFEGLRTLQARNAQAASAAEGEGALGVERQRHDVSIEEFLAFLRDVRAAAAAGVSPAVVSELERRWSEFDDLPPASRRAVLRRRARETIQALRRIAAWETPQEQAHDWTDGGAPLTPVHGAPPPAPRRLTEEQLGEIRKRYELHLGWDYLVRTIVADEARGLVCPNAAALARAREELACSAQRHSRWFDEIILAERWPTGGSEWFWRIDFAAGAATPTPADQRHQLLLARPETGAARDHGCADGALAIPVGPTAIEAVRCLDERRGALSDIARRLLLRAAEGTASAGELSEAVQELGAAVHDVGNWFAGMALEEDWPRRRNYTVDYIREVVVAHD